MSYKTRKVTKILIKSDKTMKKLKKNDKIVFDGVVGIFKGNGQVEFDSDIMYSIDPDTIDLTYDYDVIKKFENYRSIKNIINVNRMSKISFFDPKFLIQLAGFTHRSAVDVLVINSFLSPLQMKNIKSKLNDFDYINHKDIISTPQISKKKKSVEIVVIDRLGLILEIFNRRCSDDLMKIQVALVYLKYAKALLIREGDTFTAVKDIMNFNIFAQVDEIICMKKKGNRSI